MPRLTTLRSQLLLLAAGSLVPVLVLSFVLGYLVVAHEEQAFKAAALDRSRTFMTAVDAQVQGHMQTLNILATSPSLSSRLIAISGFGQPEDLRRAYDAGFDLHLTKPVAPVFLREVIGALVSARGHPHSQRMLTDAS